MAKFQAGNPGGPGRPRGRIAAFRAKLGEITGDGATVADALHKIITDPASTKKEVIDASALLLSYLLGKPEQAVSIDAEVTAGPSMIDGAAIVRELPGPVIDALIEAHERARPLALPSGLDES